MRVQHPPPPRPDPIGYTLKRLLLGRPLVTAQLRSERLSNPVALGVLSPDAISSNAYGVEEILIELLPFAGLAAFTLLLPITGVVLLILVLVTASYRQVVMAYTRAGGSYIVARENFGPRLAQVAAAALLIDYVVTVAVQSAAGTVAVVSAIRPLGPYSLEITIGVVVVMCYANLRGVREAGRSFAIPTYFFVAMLGLMILTGLVREIFWGLTVYDAANIPGAVPVHQGNGLIMGATILVVLRAFANGGSSLTGVEAISNTVSVFHKPQGRNARRVLTAMACILGFLLTGVTYLAYRTHTPPYVAGYPSVLSEVARAVFGGGWVGQVCYALVQTATALILFTGANTSFNGFPMLASFVAEDRFLPRQLTKRGHRLVFSNGIVTLTVLAVALLLVTGGSVNALVPFYAIGVFTGFAMAGYGMTKHHVTHREPGWRHKLVINLSAGVLSTVVVGIFAVAKFTEGAWLVVVIFPLLVLVLIRLNREYRAEAAILERFRTDRPEVVKYARHRVMVFVHSLDLAVLEALRYGKGLYADDLTAVHLMVDVPHAVVLQQRWDYYGLDTPLRVVDCPDRRLTRTAQQLVDAARNEHPDSHVTVLLPRRTYAPVLGRLLHDRTADKIAKAVSLLPDAAATIVPYDVQSQVRQAFPDLFEQRIVREVERLQQWVARSDQQNVDRYEHPVPPPDVIAVDGLIVGHLATVEGRVNEVDDIMSRGKPVRVVVIGDGSGELRAKFHTGRGTDIEPGDVLVLTGKARQNGTEPVYMSDPTYRMVGAAEEPETPG
ncbi:APC family permease [[Mycobacterium] crassicus]|uniref:Amino acid permease n=1 Tax=[Mycobacterium] crassicus TaxID=2872309 RepID=A0ABU5XPF6_9MYCO|nr:amino acid permease [Mycolicibacter sp. MYC098]MEB3024140.1 amino acid permease [Mycolicibacter sp. MYC098]